MGNPNLVSGPDFSKSDLIPVIAQDAEDGCVLMLAYMNLEKNIKAIQLQ